MRIDRLFHVLVLGGALAAGCGGATAEQRNPAKSADPAGSGADDDATAEYVPAPCCYAPEVASPDPEAEEAGGVACW